MRLARALKEEGVARTAGEHDAGENAFLMWIDRTKCSMLGCEMSSR
jgi:hypothetical protein